MSEIEIKHNFAKNVRELRISRGLNQIQLGEELHYTSKAISKWENEDVLPDIVTLQMIAEFFNITVDDLISSENAVKKSHKRKNQLLIAASSTLLPYFLAAITFLILYLNNIPCAWRSFIVAIPISAIVLIVFSSLWFHKATRNISILVLIWASALTTIVFMDFNEYFWIILIAAGILSIIAVIFFNIKFKSVEEKSEE